MLISLSFLIIGVIVLGFVRAPLWAWTLFGYVFLFISDNIIPLSKTFSWILWVLLITLTILFNIYPLRRALITKRILPWFKRQLPPLSSTEQIALDAGDTWWEAKLFQGVLNWQALIKMPKSKLTVEEQAFIDNHVNTFCEMLDNWKIYYEECDMPQQAWNYLKKNKFFGLIIPKTYGGLEFSAFAHSTVITKIATHNLSAAVTVMVPNSLGPAELIVRYGTEEQKNYYLPRLASGKEIPCFALTGPEAGSDAGNIPDTGIICKDTHNNQEVLGIRLTWNKRYITLAPVATVLGLAFKLYDPQHLIGDKTFIGITLCLLPTDHPGVKIGRRHIPAGGSFMNGPTQGTDVFIPLDWVIGGQAMIGQGWHMLMESLAVGRGISLPALSTAYAKHSYRSAGAYALVRQQFGLSIGAFEGVQQSLGELGGFTYMLEALRQMTLCGIDQGYNPAIATAISKYHMTELGRKAVLRSSDIHAGKGIIEGPSNYLTEYYHGVPIAITVEGANILTRNLMIFGQGAIRCHPYILSEINAAHARDQKKGLVDFDKALFAHVGYMFSNGIRTLLLGITGGHYTFNQNAHPDLSYYMNQLSRMSCALAFVADMAMLTMGGQLKRKESLSARLGDVLSYLYMACAIMRYYIHQGCSLSNKDYLYWSLDMCLFEIKNAFLGFFNNIPKKGFGKWLHWMVFPWGAHYALPKDELTQLIAKSMQTTSDIREQLLKNTFVSIKPQDAVNRVEQAFLKMLEAQPVLEKINAGIKQGSIDKKLTPKARAKRALELHLINVQEKQLFDEYETARYAAIQVDDFDPDYLKRKSTTCHNPAQPDYAQSTS